jgi:signal transduction histidine kinase
MLRTNKIISEPIDCNELSVSSSDNSLYIPKNNIVNYSSYLFIHDVELRNKYKVYQRSQINFIVHIPLNVLYVAYFITRGSLELASQNKLGIVFTAAFYSGLVFCVLDVLFIYAIIIEIYRPKGTSMKVIKKKLCSNILFENIESLLAISNSLYLGLFLIARTLAGKCPEEFDYFEQSRCNHDALSNSIPFDQYVMILMSTMSSLFAFRGVSWFSILVIFLVSFVSFTISVSILKDFHNSIWEAIFFLLVFISAYELERSRQSEFFNTLFCNHEITKVKTYNHTIMRYLSHEIRSPLNIISCSSKILYEDLEANDSAVNTIQDITNACNYAVEILDHFLIFDGLRSNKMHIERIWLRVFPTLYFMIDHIKEIGVVYSIDDHLSNNLDLYFHIDESRIEQILRNIIMHLTNFTENKKTLFIKLRFEQDQDKNLNLFRKFGEKFEPILFEFCLWGNLLIDVSSSEKSLLEKNDYNFFEGNSELNLNLLQGYYSTYNLNINQICIFILSFHFVRRR